MLHFLIPPILLVVPVAVVLLVLDVVHVVVGLRDLFISSILFISNILFISSINLYINFLSCISSFHLFTLLPWLFGYWLLLVLVIDLRRSFLSTQCALFLFHLGLRGGLRLLLLLDLCPGPVTLF